MEIPKNKICSNGKWALEEHTVFCVGRQETRLQTEDRDQNRKGLLAAEDLILQVKVSSNRLTLTGLC